MCMASPDFSWWHEQRHSSESNSGAGKGEPDMNSSKLKVDAFAT